MSTEETDVVEPARLPAGDPAENPAAEEKREERPAPSAAKAPRVPLPSSLQAIVGALLFASKTPLSATDLRNAIREVEPEEGDDAEIMKVYGTCTAREVNEALHGLEKELERSACGFRLVCAAGTYRLQTDPACGRYVRSLLKLDRPNRLTRAGLETLAVIAYRQPISRSEVEQIRGVAVDSIMKTLVDLQLVRIVGRSELPGHPFLYGTTQLFLEHFGLASLQQLNELDPTLQRSDPRERAAAYRRPEPKKAEGEDTQSELPLDGKAPEAPAAPAEEPAEATGDDEPGSDADEAEEPVRGEAGAEDVDGAADEEAEEEDEFDDDDEEEDEDGEEDEDEEGE